MPVKDVVVNRLKTICAERGIIDNVKTLGEAIARVSVRVPECPTSRKKR